MDMYHYCIYMHIFIYRLLTQLKEHPNKELRIYNMYYLLDILSQDRYITLINNNMDIAVPTTTTNNNNKNNNTNGTTTTAISTELQEYKEYHHIIHEWIDQKMNNRKRSIQLLLDHPPPTHTPTHAHESNIHISNQSHESSMSMKSIVPVPESESDSVPVPFSRPKSTIINNKYLKRYINKTNHQSSLLKSGISVEIPSTINSNNISNSKTNDEKKSNNSKYKFGLMSTL